MTSKNGRVRVHGKNSRRLRIKIYHEALHNQYLDFCQKVDPALLVRGPLTYAQWLHPQMREIRTHLA